MSDVYEMTVPQAIHLARVYMKWRNLERVHEIRDSNVALAGDERQYREHVNRLLYG